MKKQNGFAHIAILTIILAVAVVGLLGFVFWQNFLQPKVTNNTSSSANTSSTPQKTDPTQVALSNIAYDHTAGSGLAVKYPNGWNLVHSDLAPGSDDSVQRADTNTITSPDGTITVKLMAGIEGIGGMCDSTDTRSTISSYYIDSIPNYSGYSVITLVSHDSRDGYYYYSAGVVQNRADFEKAKIGGSPCYLSSIAFSAKKNDVTSWLNIKLNNITDTRAKTAAEINDAMNTDSFKIAKRIILSLYQKD